MLKQWVIPAQKVFIGPLAVCPGAPVDGSAGHLAYDLCLCHVN